MVSDPALGPSVQVDFTLALGAGRLEASLPVPAGNVTLTQLLPVLQSLTSNIVDSAVQIASGEGYQVSCRAGCGACCRQLVPLSIFEAEALSTWLLDLPEDRRQHLKLRFDYALRALSDTGILARLNPAAWDDESPSTQTLVADYLAEKIPCPFLEEESCSIHPIRPLACREYLVTTSPEFCASPTRESVTPIPIPLKPSRVLYKLGGLVEQSSNGWMPLVFLFAWIGSGSHPGEAISGPGPELLYEFVKRLTPS